MIKHFLLEFKVVLIVILLFLKAVFKISFIWYSGTFVSPLALTSPNWTDGKRRDPGQVGISRMRGQLGSTQWGLNDA